MLVTPPPAMAGALHECGRARSRAAAGHPGAARAAGRPIRPSKRRRPRPRLGESGRTVVRRRKEAVAHLGGLTRPPGGPLGRAGEQKAERAARDPQAQEKVRGLRQ
ncbi:hypothetical protein Arub01_26680 [Actinomadura rubrobrunea]|uniref:Uncharacterized protein n=1 Tax=Actinomadura rubrobrunea TaxID=115335 RepID=A0A9W6PTV7_9ACTN|nr:hypothetical protein Arub01_26680 [Actinomadura rubrobrunea]